MTLAGRGRLDTVSIAGAAVFSALAIVLGAFSQALGLNFPVIPYLQFDLGEVAIILAFFIFGPVPALVSSFVEFLGLWVFGQNIPVGPPLKLFALVSTVAGLWVGTRLALRRSGVGLGRLVGSGGLVGALVRAGVTTVPNFYLLLFYYSFSGIVYYLKGYFSLIGVNLTEANALFFILALTAIFNVLQLGFALGVSYVVLKFPVISRIKIGGRPPWFSAAMGKVGGTASEPRG